MLAPIAEAEQACGDAVDRMLSVLAELSAGEVTVLAALRARATGPRTIPWP